MFHFTRMNLKSEAQDKIRSQIVDELAKQVYGLKNASDSYIASIRLDRVSFLTDLLHDFENGLQIKSTLWHDSALWK